MSLPHFIAYFYPRQWLQDHIHCCHRRRNCQSRVISRPHSDQRGRLVISPFTGSALHQINPYFTHMITRGAVLGWGRGTAPRTLARLPYFRVLVRLSWEVQMIWLGRHPHFSSGISLVFGWDIIQGSKNEATSSEARSIAIDKDTYVVTTLIPA